MFRGLSLIFMGGLLGTIVTVVFVSLFPGDTNEIFAMLLGAAFAFAGIVAAFYYENREPNASRYPDENRIRCAKKEIQ